MRGLVVYLLFVEAVSLSVCTSHDKVNNVENKNDAIEALLSRLRAVKREKEEEANVQTAKRVEETLKSELQNERKVYSKNEKRDELVKLLVERVIGGSDISKGSWPWLVFIKAEYKVGRWWSRQTKTIHCGASLLSDRWLLTAAHCVSGQYLGNPKNWHALLGDNDRDSSLWDRGKGWLCKLFGKTSCIHYRIKVQKIITHPRYSASSLWYNDIALMKLETAVPAGTVVARIGSVTLNSDSNFPADGAQCIMKGWGCTQHGGQAPRIARQVVLPKINDGACSSRFRIDTSTRLCAGYNLGGKGICPGDSGGPLVCKKNGKWVQVGIASFTSARKPENWPGAFTRVSAYLSWIQSTMRSN